MGCKGGKSVFGTRVKKKQQWKKKSRLKRLNLNTIQNIKKKKYKTG